MENKSAPGKFSLFLERVIHFYPFSFLGTAVFACGIFLLVFFITSANPLSLIFSAGFLFITILSAVMGRLNALALRTAVIEWDSSLPLVSDSVDCHQIIHMENALAFPFFNLHFCLAGKLKVGRTSSIHIREEHPLIPRKSMKIPYPLYFPLAGILTARGSYVIRDIFGLSRAGFGEYQTRTITVLPPGVPSLALKDIVTNQGFEESIKKRSQDEERYFMREYMPGDRLRDINWKATSRLSKLITKIAPMTQEQTKSVFVFFRNIKESLFESFEAVVHLNRAKSLLLSFLRQVKQAGKEYVFQVITAEDKYVLETEEDIERFSIDLAGLEYEPVAALEDYDRNIGEVFVFTTQYDTGLGHFLALFPRVRATVMQTVTASKNDKSEHSVFRFFAPFRASLIPGSFIFRKEKRPRIGTWSGHKDIVHERDLIEIRLS
jgi:hypothetical protein